MKALLIIDVQNDFLSGGALAIKESDLAIPYINKLVGYPFAVVVASKDWHPQDHGSFAKIHRKEPGEHIILDGLDQILWPVHAVQGSFGAEFSKLLDVSKVEKVFYKGTYF